MNEADPRVKRTRKLIVEAFFALLAEKSLHAISVQDIAERATVNRATFYTHFEDKYALMDWVVRDQFREALTQRLGSAPRFSLDNLCLLVVTVCEFLGQFQGHCAPGGRSVEPQVEMKVQEELATFLLGWLRQAPLAPGHAGGPGTRPGTRCHCRADGQRQPLPPRARRFVREQAPAGPRERTCRWTAAAAGRPKGYVTPNNQ